jgi:hypothetical protein
VERELILKACDAGDVAGVQQIVSDINEETYSRSVLLAAMGDVDVDAARSSVKDM